MIYGKKVVCFGAADYSQAIIKGDINNLNAVEQKLKYTIIYNFSGIRTALNRFPFFIKAGLFTSKSSSYIGSESLDTTVK